MHILKGHEFGRVFMGLWPTQVDGNASVASAPEGRHENSPGRQPWVDGRTEAPCPGGAAEISPKISKELFGIFNRAEYAPTIVGGFSPRGKSSQSS